MKKTKLIMMAACSAVLLAFLPCCSTLQQDVSISADSSRDDGLSDSAAMEIAKALEGLKLTIGAKAAATGKIFGSVNTIQIANAIKEASNIEIDRKRISLNEDAIKELGNYKAKIKLHKDVQTEIEFEVVAE